MTRRLPFLAHAVTASILAVAAAVLAPSAAWAAPSALDASLVSKLTISVDQNHVLPGASIKVTFAATTSQGGNIPGSIRITEASADGSISTVLFSGDSYYQDTAHFLHATLNQPGDYTFGITWLPPAGVDGAEGVAATQVQVRATGATGILSVGPSVTGAPTPVTMTIAAPGGFSTAGTVHVQLDATSDAAVCSSTAGGCTAQLSAATDVGPHTVTVTWVGDDYNTVTQMANFTTAAPKSVKKTATSPTASTSTGSGASAPAISTPTPSASPSQASTPVVTAGSTPDAEPQLNSSTVASTSTVPVALVAVLALIVVLIAVGAVILIVLLRTRRLRA